MKHQVIQELHPQLLQESDKNISNTVLEEFFQNSVSI